MVPLPSTENIWMAFQSSLMGDFSDISHPVASDKSDLITPLCVMAPMGFCWWLAAISNNSGCSRWHTWRGDSPPGGVKSKPFFSLSSITCPYLARKSQRTWPSQSPQFVSTNRSSISILVMPSNFPVSIALDRGLVIQSISETKSGNCSCWITRFPLSLNGISAVSYTHLTLPTILLV